MVAVALLDTGPDGLDDPAPRPSRAGPFPPGARAVAGLVGPTCRWPIGEVAEEEFRFCGAPRVRGSYCRAHRRMAYRKSRR